MKDVLNNVWLKRCVSVFCAAYAAVIAVCVVGGMIGTPRHRGVRRRRRR